MYKKGFTLIELMLVMCILGILIAIAIPNYIEYRNKAFCSYAEQDAQNIAVALTLYFSEPNHTHIPQLSDLQGVNGLQLNNNEIEIDGESKNKIKVSVTDSSNRCPRGHYYTIIIGGVEGYWE
jgi:type IV pilus assembly protein PilA